MAFLKNLVLVSSSLVSSVSFAQGGTIPAVESAQISVFGTGPAVEAELVQEVRKAIAEAYAEGAIENIQFLGFGIEGGFGVCVSGTAFSPKGELAKLAQKILAIPHDPRRTSLNAEKVDACPQ